jgi:beta-lactamase class A
MASLPRRRLLLGAVALGLSGCGRRPEPETTARTPKLDMAQLNRDVGAIAGRLAPGVLGVGLMNLESGEAWTLSGARPMPMQSVFKAPLAAAVLAEVDAGRLSLAERFTLKPMDLSPWSPIAAAWPGRADYTAGELLAAAVDQSDNTAADVLMARIGGPGVVTAWLVGAHVDEVSIDRYEREIQTEILGLAPFRPAWKDPAVFQQARETVPAAHQSQAMAAYLADPRDTATPRGALSFLAALHDGQLISPGSRRLLLQLMASAPSGAARIKAGLPKGSSLAHKTGTGPMSAGVLSAINDIGIVTLPDRRRYAASVFLAGATLAPAACEAAIAEVARALMKGVR